MRLLPGRLIRVSSSWPGVHGRRFVVTRLLPAGKDVGEPLVEARDADGRFRAFPRSLCHVVRS